FMPPKTAPVTTFTERDWVEAQAELAAAQRAVAASPAGIARQAPFDRALGSERRCTEIIHDWLSRNLEMDRVGEPRLLLSLDVDGVLEDWSEGFTSRAGTGPAALPLLQLGQVAVLLNTAHSRQAVRQRAQQFHLFGGV